jgi:hypothetical protein
MEKAASLMWLVLEGAAKPRGTGARTAMSAGFNPHASVLWTRLSVPLIHSSQTRLMLRG